MWLWPWRFTDDVLVKSSFQTPQGFWHDPYINTFLETHRSLKETRWWWTRMGDETLLSRAEERCAASQDVPVMSSDRSSVVISKVFHTQLSEVLRDHGCEQSCFILVILVLIRSSLLCLCIWENAVVSVLVCLFWCLRSRLNTSCPWWPFMLSLISSNHATTFKCVFKPHTFVD